MFATSTLVFAKAQASLLRALVIFRSISLSFMAERTELRERACSLLTLELFLRFGSTGQGLAQFLLDLCSFLFRCYGFLLHSLGKFHGKIQMPTQL